MSSELRAEFIEFLAHRFPALKPELMSPLISENLLANHVLDLPKSVLRQAQDFVEAAFALRQSPTYRDFHSSEFVRRGIAEPGNYSIAMSYDFHLDESGILKLIEINTNASFLALGDFLYQSQGLPRPVGDFTIDELHACLLEELHLIGRKVHQPHPRARIVDEEPESQRLYAEFLLYREIFKSWGWEAEIQDTRKISGEYDVIYNRDTDFYLDKPEHQSLKQAWLRREFVLSPNPAEYLLLADKERQLEWNRPGFLESTGLAGEKIATLRRHLPKAQDLTRESAETLWAERKNLFLKPKRSFGAKQSYRGGSISRKAFDELIGQEIIAQEFVPAPEVEIAVPDGTQKMKYDLRFYAYKGRVQSAVARLYQGQVTNLRTPHGGFACVRFG